MTFEEIQELAALEALGSLDPSDSRRLQDALALNPAAAGEVARFSEVVASLCEGLPRRTPPAQLRDRVLARVKRTPQAPSTASAPPGFLFVMGANDGWRRGPIPGLRVRPLAYDSGRDLATLVIELQAGAVFPGHEHEGPEDMYVLSGDLTTEGRRLGPGDYLHADPGSRHHALTTERGCQALIILPIKTAQWFFAA